MRAARPVLKAAVLQLCATADVEANLDIAFRLVDRAAYRGADIVVLPEKFNYLFDPPDIAGVAESLDGPLSTSLAQLAARHGIFLLGGSIWETIPGESRAYNTSVLYGPQGQRLAVYRKIHMFDVEVGGHVYRESDSCRPGEQVVAAQLPLPSRVVLGLSVCYDLRFPALYRALAELGADIVTVPAAFTMATGRDHWEVLLRARAIENQAYVLAANQVGMHQHGLESYGHSMIVDPWGVVLARVAGGEGLALAELDLARLERIREYLPSRRHFAGSVYERRVFYGPDGCPASLQPED